MRTFVLRRLLQIVPLLLGISALTFLLLQLAPGDFLATVAENPQVSHEVLEQMRRNFGLDRPWYVQYLLYLKNVFLHGDFGQSFAYHRPVFAVLGTGLLNTLLLASAAMLVTWGLAVPLGALAAARQHTWIDRVLSLGAFVWLSTPEVLSGLLLLMLAARTGWFPAGGMHGDGLDDANRSGDVLRHLEPPALVVGSCCWPAGWRQMRARACSTCCGSTTVTTACAKVASKARRRARRCATRSTC